MLHIRVGLGHFSHANQRADLASIYGRGTEYSAYVVTADDVLDCGCISLDLKALACAKLLAASRSGDRIDTGNIEPPPSRTSVPPT